MAVDSVSHFYTCYDENANCTNIQL